MGATEPRLACMNTTNGQGRIDRDHAQPHVAICMQICSASTEIKDNFTLHVLLAST